MLSDAEIGFVIAAVTCAIAFIRLIIYYFVELPGRDRVLDWH